MKRHWLPRILSATRTREVALRVSVAAVLGVALRIIAPLGPGPAAAQADTTAKTPAFPESSRSVCPAIEPLTQVEIFRCPNTMVDSLFPGDSHGRVLHGGAAPEDSFSVDALIARASSARKEDISACYRSSGVSSGELGLQLSAADGFTVFLATAQAGDLVAAEACTVMRTSDAVSTGVQWLGPRDVLLFPVELQEVRYVAAVSAVVLEKPDLMKRMAAFMARGAHRPILPLVMTIVSVDTVRCLSDIRAAKGPSVK